MSKNYKKDSKTDFGDLPSNYIVNAGKKMIENKIISEQIKEDKDGNCTIGGYKIEANACSMLKDDYKV
ncbi:hypothetical protein [Clostridium aciditolerans]|uniref:Uncharacterized protein n=1 Tax=Clostridium aciditolerans TaxID=339861 RepID=A0A934M0W0_9CLOT|nr:hypothetical protein [Clostridium aciditolerans]MBI6872594.1 hypothetical protein [Clostridium aciditolerans]